MQSRIEHRLHVAIEAPLCFECLRGIESQLDLDLDVLGATHPRS
jgi:hypothetical protein